MRAARTIREHCTDAGIRPAPLELQPTRSSPPELRLLPAWSNPVAGFAGNVWDVVRGRLRLVGRARPDPFWYGAGLEAPLPWRPFRISLLLHGALIALLCAYSVWPEARVHLVRLRAQGGMTSLYLPELHGARVVRKHGGKADPVLAAQEIRSIPPAADNRRQTIAMPSPRTLQRQIDLPNLVAYQAPQAPPLDKSVLGTVLGLFDKLPELAQRTAEIVQQQPQRALPDTHRAAAQPAPEIGTLGRDAAKVAQLMPPARDPALPSLQRRAEIVQLRPQRVPSSSVDRTAQAAPNLASGSAAELARLIAPAGNASAPVLRRTPQIVQARPQRRPQASPQSSSTSGAAGGAQAEPQPESFGSKVARTLSDLLPQRAEPGLAAPAAQPEKQQILALNAHPADVPLPATLPEGNRRGAFAASPSGHENATGEPGTGASSGIGAHDPGTKVNAPAGISVGAPPSPSTPTTGSGSTPGTGSAKASTADPEFKSKLFASARTPAIGSIPPHTPPQTPVEREPASSLSALENQVFAGRRSYKLVVNMPNLNSANGSWIIRYAEREPGTESEPIIAPEVILKSDPALRNEMIEGGLHGTVVLSAIILADGSVDQIKVVQSVFPELDSKAAEALSRWLFHPALKNGQPIEVQALVVVPFVKR